MAQRLDVGKQERWLELIRRWLRSHMTIREFCRRHQISEASFFSWRRVLRQRGLLDELMPVKSSGAAPTFVKLTTFDAESAVSPIEVVLNQRRLLRVRPGFDAEMLLELVRLLEEPGC
jgi:transposase-like protein